MQQVAVLGGHREAAGPSHPHHISPQISEDHPRVRTRPDATELDDPHSSQWPAGSHYDYRPFFTCSTRSRSALVAESMVPLTARLRTKPGSGTFGSARSSN